MRALDPDRADGLKQSAAHGFKWTALAHGIRLSVHLLTTAVLAWLLLPEDFGLVGMATVVVGFVHLFRDFGTAAAVVQRPDMDERALSTLFWTNVVAGFALTAVIAGSAPAVAQLFAEPRMVAVLQALALGVFLASLGVVQTSSLQKRLRFACLARIEILALITGGATGLTMAFWGHGVWALVWQTLVTTGMHSLLAILGSSFRPRWQFHFPDLQAVAGYGLNLSGSNVLNWLSRNLDQVLIGIFLGATALGYYALAYRLLLFPLQAVGAVLGRVMFPIFARIQDDDARVRHIYVKVTAAVVMVLFPVMVGLMLVSQPMVVSLLGPKWLPAVPLIAVFAVVALLQAVGATVGPIYQAKGRTDLLLRWGVYAALMLSVALVVGLTWGTMGVAVAYALVSVVLFIPGLVIPFRLIGLRLRDLGRALVPSLVATAAMAAATLSVRYAIADHVSPVAHLVVAVLAGVLSYGLASLLWNRGPLFEVRDLLLRRT